MLKSIDSVSIKLKRRNDSCHRTATNITSRIGGSPPLTVNAHTGKQVRNVQCGPITCVSSFPFTPPHAALVSLMHRHSRLWAFVLALLPSTFPRPSHLIRPSSRIHLSRWANCISPSRYRSSDTRSSSTNSPQYRTQR